MDAFKGMNSLPEGNKSISSWKSPQEKENKNSRSEWFPLVTHSV